MFGLDTSGELLWGLGLWPEAEKLVMVRVWALYERSSTFKQDRRVTWLGRIFGWSNALTVMAMTWMVCGRSTWQGI
jgi:hypothetical protein